MSRTSETTAALGRFTCSLERLAERQEAKLQQLETVLGAYRREMKKQFEHEIRVKELLPKQAELNTALDLDKSDATWGRVRRIPKSRPAGVHASVLE